MARNVTKTEDVTCPEGFGEAVHTGVFRQVPVHGQDDTLILLSERCDLEDQGARCYRACGLGKPDHSPLSNRWEGPPPDVRLPR